MPAPEPVDRPARKTSICSIGASAGGVGALQDLFANLRDDIGLAYIVIVHLAPDKPSHLCEILRLRTNMPVQQVDAPLEVQSNHVYIISPDRELTIEGDDVAARPFSEPRGSRAPIDLFFRSVAAAGGDGIAVVLSGSGSDGALGVRAIKEAGGLVFVQDPAEAEYPMMPRAAIATGVVDFVGPVARLAGLIAELGHSKVALSSIMDEETEKDLRQIIAFLRARTGHDFQEYKRSTVLRRVARRMQVTQQDRLNAYYRFMLANPEEASQLLSDLLISVTQFFRDPEAFAVLAEKAIKPIFEQARDDMPIRVWAVGCATGEEAYSLGILMIEEANRRNVRPVMQIFASDLDDTALAVAREGCYPKAIEADISEQRLHRFFTEGETNYRVRKELRDLVLFASHSALRDPPFIRVDLIVCRNLLIYLQRDLQRQLCNLFHYALKPNGFLFLGSAETIDATPSLFDVVDREARIYTARVVPERAAPLLPQVATDRRFLQLEPRPLVVAETPLGVGQVHAMALEQHAPPSVLVDSAGRVLNLSSTVGRFFLPSEGPFTSELVAQVRPELRIDLKLALQRAFENAESSLTPPVRVAFNGHRNMISLHVAPMGRGDGGAIGNAIVFFLDGGPARPTEDSGPDDDANRDEIIGLRQELTTVQDRLSVSRHVYAQATQELRAANEELQSVNEEYRSTAEELETSKEELQSMNEELQTVNAELNSKLETISSAHNDLQNLMAATEIGTLFLDTTARIKLFTPAVANLFNITGNDIGRAISDFTHRLVYDGLEDDAARVSRTLQPSETEVKTRAGNWLTMRIRPYRTVDDKIEGVVVTFVDITGRKQAEEALADEMRAMTRLQRLATEMLTSGEIEGPLGAILDAAIELLGADFGNVQLYDEQRKVLRIAVHRGLDQRFLEHFATVEASEGSARGLALAKGQQVAIEDVENDPAFGPSVEEARVAGFRAVLSTPLFASAGRLVGILSTQFRAPRTFSSHDLRLIDICARQAADAINVASLQQSVRESEARLRKVLETEAVGVLFLNDAGTLTDCNDAFLRMTGYTRVQVAGGELTWRMLTQPDSPPGAAMTPVDSLAASGRIGPFETEFLREDGARLWMLVTGRRVEANLIAEFAIDISDRKRAEQERELLARELSHRVKNTLAVVQALATQTTGTSVKAFRDAFVGRLRALAQTHDLLLETSSWQEADIGLLTEQAMAAYMQASSNAVRIDGPSLGLKPKQALGMRLVLHEMATNASKYGALSVTAGRILISWRKETDEAGKPILRFTWLEENGPAVTPPETKGFGTQLIVRACEYELDGTVKLLYANTGLRADIAFPLT